MDKRICIVEDDEDARFLMKLNLLKEGYNIELFSTGIRLTQKTDRWPNLFILDIDLPGMSGLEICRWIKSQQHTKDIPVLFVSGSPDLEALATNEEADDYLAKPFTFPHLLSKINNCIQKYPSRYTLA
jgi:DNA-binding response OmpR family regulator